MQVEDKVNYHSIIGGPVTSTGHRITHILLMPNNFNNHVAWITGKDACVDLRALSYDAKYEVILAWAQKKRHIVVDRKILCEPKFSHNVLQRGEVCYNSISISGIPDYHKLVEDTKYTHFDGIIPFRPLHKIGGIIETSICAKCKRKYERLIHND